MRVSQNGDIDCFTDTAETPFGLPLADQVISLPFAARFAAEEVEFWRDAGIYYFVPCVFEGGAIAVLALGRKERDEPFNSEDLALLTAVAGQVATAIENGRLYRQLHLKAEEIGRMREFNENILESLDDGLIVFDSDERIVRWNRALESFYGVDRAAAIGRPLAEIFDRPFVDALRAALQERPEGATLYRVPLTGARGESRVLVNATAVPLHDGPFSTLVTSLSGGDFRPLTMCPPVTSVPPPEMIR